MKQYRDDSPQPEKWNKDGEKVLYGNKDGGISSATLIYFNDVLIGSSPNISPFVEIVYSKKTSIKKVLDIPTKNEKFWID